MWRLSDQSPGYRTWTWWATLCGAKRVYSRHLGSRIHGLRVPEPDLPPPRVSEASSRCPVEPVRAQLAMGLLVLRPETDPGQLLGLFDPLSALFSCSGTALSCLSKGPGPPQRLGQASATWWER